MAVRFVVSDLARLLHIVHGRRTHGAALLQQLQARVAPEREVVGGGGRCSSTTATTVVIAEVAGVVALVMRVW